MKVYLGVYNLVQFFGWLSLLVRTVCLSPLKYYEISSIEMHIKVVQGLMALEVGSN